MKKLFCAFLALMLLASSFVCAHAETESNRAYDYILTAVADPCVGSVGGEWSVISVFRGSGGSAAFKEKYLQNVRSFVTEGSAEKLRRCTDFARITLALTAVGEDAQSFCGFDFTLPLTDTSAVAAQGTNSVIWSLIALNCREWTLSRNKITAAKEFYTAELLARQNDDGGWSLSGTDSSADVTAMALCALPENTADAEKGVSFLSDVQCNNGGYESYGTENAESAAQVLLSLCMRGISPDDTRFAKGNGVLGALLEYQCASGAFSHTKNGSENLMATEQAALALAAINRQKSEETPLFNMRDVSVTAACPFDDMLSHPAKEAVVALYSQQIINGKSENMFDPNGCVTRAEAAALFVRMLGVTGECLPRFCDVSDTDWFFTPVCTAAELGIVNGVDDTHFSPHQSVTTAELCTMAARFLKLVGLNANCPADEISALLSNLADGGEIPSYARAAVALCVNAKILPLEGGRIYPNVAASRAQTATVIYNLKKEVSVNEKS